MALDPSAAYGAQVDTSDPAGYPQGQARNITVAGDGTGTPLEKKWVSDIWGFEQAMLAAASITPSGTPDKVGASQYLTALKAIFGRQVGYFYLDNVATAPNGKFTLIQEATYGTGTWGLASNEIELPAAGLWFVLLHTFVQADQVTNPLPFQVRGLYGGTGGTGIFFAKNTRFSASTSDAIKLTAFGLAPITTPGTEKIVLTNNTSGNDLLPSASSDLDNALILVNLGLF